MSMNRFDDDKLRAFFYNVSIFDLERFCKDNGYCVVIANQNIFWVEKEIGR